MNESTNGQVTIGSCFIFKYYIPCFILEPVKCAFASIPHGISEFSAYFGWLLREKFCYILDHRDLLQESGGLILRVHNSNKSGCCFLIAVASCMYISLVKEIKEAHRHLIRMRTIKTVPNSLCEPPFND